MTHILFYICKPNSSYYIWLFLLLNFVKISNTGHSLEKTVYGLGKSHSAISQDVLLNNKQVLYFSTLVIFSTTFEVFHMSTLAVKLQVMSALQEELALVQESLGRIREV